MKWMVRTALVALLITLTAVQALACYEPAVYAVQTDGRYVVWVKHTEGKDALMAGTITSGRSISSVKTLSSKIDYSLGLQSTFAPDMIGGGIVAWLEPTSTGSQLWLRDLNDASSVNVLIRKFSSAETATISQPAVAARKLVWRQGQSIIKYDPDTDVFSTIKTYSSDFTIIAPQVSSTWIVWGLLSHTGSQGQQTVVATDINGKSMRNLITYSCAGSCYEVFALSGDQLLYSSKATDWSVGYATKQVTNLSTNQSYQLEPNRYWDHADGDYAYDTSAMLAFNLKTQQTFTLPFYVQDVRDGWIVGTEGDNVMLTRSANLK